MKIDEINAWEAFRGVAVHGNFSKAAKALRLAIPQLSKRVSKLEDQLGVRLFARSTRVVTLTDEGRALLPKVTAVLEDLAGLESSFEDKQELQGVVRIASVSFIAHRFLIPLMKEFMRLHPGIQVELVLSEGMVNLIETGTDLAIRIDDEPSDSSMVYRKLLPNQLILCASPGYLKKVGGAPKKESDLLNHPMLMLDVHADSRFEKSGVRLADVARKRNITCSDGWLLTELALQDFGILVRSIWDVRDHLQKGKLVQLLERHPIEVFGHVYAVIPSRRYLAPRVRAFLDFTVKYAEQWI